MWHMQCSMKLRTGRSAEPLCLKQERILLLLAYWDAYAHRSACCDKSPCTVTSRPSGSSDASHCARSLRHALTVRSETRDARAFRSGQRLCLHPDAAKEYMQSGRGPGTRCLSRPSLHQGGKMQVVAVE